MNTLPSLDIRFLHRIASASSDGAPPFIEGYRPPDTFPEYRPPSALLLGFSGGVDSSVLLFLTYFYAKQNGIPLRLVHLHHGIRGKEADRDAAFAERIAEVYGLPLTLVRKDIPAIAAKSGESLESAARRIRYEVFRETMREHDIPVLLTAHNSDDNLETVLFHLLRGSGLTGLCGIPPAREIECGIVLRPLLGTPRSEIEAFAEANAIPFVLDSTNADNAYTRNKLRNELLPVLRSVFPSPERAVTRMTESLREDKEFLDSLARELLHRADTGDGLLLSELRNAPDPILRRALLAYWQEQIPHLDSYAAVHLDALLAFVKNGRTGTHLSLRRSVAEVGRERLFVRPPTPRSHPPTDVSHILKLGRNDLPELGVSLYLGNESEIPEEFSQNPSKTSPKAEKNIYNSATKIALCFDTIKKRAENGNLCVRSRRPGDRILMRGMHRSLRTLSNEAHLSEEERARLIVVTSCEEILWIPGLALRDGIRSASTGDETVLAVKTLPTE